jgi:hypothetical protein
MEEYMFKVAVVGPIHEEGMKLFQERSDIEATVVQDLSPAGIAKGVTGVDAITIRTQLLPREILEKNPNGHRCGRELHGRRGTCADDDALAGEGRP